MRQRVITSGLAIAVITAMSLGLGACSSGHDTSNSGNSGAANPDTTTDNPADRINLIASSTTLDSAAVNDNGGVTLTAIVRDADNNAVSDPEVMFTSDAGRLVESKGAANGTATATLYNDPDRANRAIKVTATLDSLRDSLTLPVTGTTLSLNGPASVHPGDTADFEAALTDSADAPIASVPLTIKPAEQIVLPTGGLDTDTDGQLSFGVRTTKAGSIDVDASALNASTGATLKVAADRLEFAAPEEQGASISAGDTTEFTVVAREKSGDPAAGVEVDFQASSGALSSASTTTDGNGRASVKLKTARSGSATVTATYDEVQTSRSVDVVAGQPSGLLVDAAPATVPTGERSRITASVRDIYGNAVPGTKVGFALSDPKIGQLDFEDVITNDNGEAVTNYSAPTKSFARNVEISARATDDLEKRTTIRVAGDNLAITLGTGGGAQLSSDGTTYNDPFAVLVTDEHGAAAPGADLRLSLRNIAYQSSERNDLSCPAEDDDNNGKLNDDEDRNGNGRLDPGRIASVPVSPTLDASGVARFNVTYLSRYAGRVRVELTATAKVAGSEGSQKITFDLPGDPASTNPFADCNE